MPDDRMTDPAGAPEEKTVVEWIGAKAHSYWKKITRLIEQRYPGVFTPEWLFAGRKHGWSLRYRKSRSFCTLIPEKNRFALLIVFGAEERAKVEAMKETLSRDTRTNYDKATTYHDGKWLVLAVDSDKVVEDVALLLAVKRRPKKAGKK